MSDRTCKTCRFWTELHYVTRTVTNVCGMAGTRSSDQDSTMFEIELRAPDDHNVEAILRTGPDFGCVLHDK